MGFGGACCLGLWRMLISLILRKSGVSIWVQKLRRRHYEEAW